MDEGCSLGIMNESSSSLYGRVNYTTSGSTITGFAAYVNIGNTVLSSASSANKAKIARSVACHELGHLLGLNDLTSGTAVMNTNRNRLTLYTPQTDDINGVSAGY